MGIRRLMARRRVDFPDPEGPMMEMNSPLLYLKGYVFQRVYAVWIIF